MAVKLRYPGQYFDSWTGLYYNWNRHYHPGTGKYVSGDPMGLAGGLNTYFYANANLLHSLTHSGLAGSTGRHGQNFAGCDRATEWTDRGIRRVSFQRLCVA